MEKDIPGVICNDVEELVALVLHHRTQSPEDIDVKLGIDGGQGSLKVTLSLTLKPDSHDTSWSPPSKRFQYSDGYGSGDFKDSSVHKTLILALVPTMNESYVNLKMLLDKLNLNSLEYSLSEDIKVMLQTLGKQPAACSHPCPYCETSKPDMLKAPHNTLASLCAWHDEWISAGGKLKEAKYYQNVVHPPLLTGKPDSKILELINIPGLHILLGIVDKILVEMEKGMFENKEIGFQFFSSYLASINLARVSYQGQHRLEGNACNMFLKKLDKLDFYLKEHNLGLQGAKYIKVLRDFNRVVHGCFGKTVSPTYNNDIKTFSESYRDLGTTVSVKVHMVEQHVVEFIEMKGGEFGKYISTCFCNKKKLLLFIILLHQFLRKLYHSHLYTEF